MTVKPLVVRPRDAMRMLGVCKSTIFAWMNAGRLERVRLGERAVGITVESIERLLWEGAAKPAPRAWSGDVAAICVKEADQP